MRHLSLFMFLAALSAFSFPTSLVAKSIVSFGKTDWKLTVTASDARLLQDLRQNTYIPWCFDALKGRGMLKDLTLSLHWDAAGLPRLSLAKDELRTHQEDLGLIGCLDASIREFPPKHERTNDELQFVFIRSRK
ncbi:MAG: hypothetical protein H7318_11000 [Oligoflexus sp.]|nr:hypothetical protein [Oligoflexus sp.]